MNEITQINALQLVFCIEKRRFRSFIWRLNEIENLDLATLMRFNVYVRICFVALWFIYSEKATKFGKISTNYLTGSMEDK